MSSWYYTYCISSKWRLKLEAWCLFLVAYFESTVDLSIIAAHLHVWGFSSRRPPTTAVITFHLFVPEHFLRSGTLFFFHLTLQKTTVWWTSTRICLTDWSLNKRKAHRSTQILQGARYLRQLDLVCLQHVRHAHCGPRRLFETWHLFLIEQWNPQRLKEIWHLFISGIYLRNYSTGTLPNNCSGLRLHPCCKWWAMATKPSSSTKENLIQPLLWLLNMYSGCGAGRPCPNYWLQQLCRQLSVCA